METNSPTRLLTTREYAEALDLSESSVKRWADEGRIAVTRTPGGHRRITAQEGVRFAREARLTVVRPSLLGLGDHRHVDSEELSRLATDLLRRGHQDAFQAAILSAFAGGESIARIGDLYIAPALEHIGEEWLQAGSGIFIEHRATEIVVATLHRLRALVPRPAPEAPLAIGGSPEGDVYTIPSLLVSLVVEERGLRSVNLGANLPFPSLIAAINAHDPAHVWVAFRSGECLPEFEPELAELTRSPLHARRRFHLGGRTLPQRLRQLDGGNVAAHDNLQQFDACLGGIAAS